MVLLIFIHFAWPILHHPWARVKKYVLLPLLCCLSCALLSSLCLSLNVQPIPLSSMLFTSHIRCDLHILRKPYSRAFLLFSVVWCVSVVCLLLQ